MKTFSISEVAEALGVSAHTLRYYERAGLLDRVTRIGGRRRYAEADLAWIRFLQRLRATGMPIRQIDRYAQLRREGDSSIAARIELLERHLQWLMERERELARHRAALSEKITLYRHKQQSSKPRPTSSGSKGKS